MTLPNFLILGAQKAGTTWLANTLGSHPEVFMAPGEIHYFNIEHNYRKGLGWYEEHFKRASNFRAVGEKTPNYLWVTERPFSGRSGTHLPRLHELLHGNLPEARLIIVLRDPVERAISAVNHYIRMGQLPPDCDIDEVLIGNQRHLADAYGVIDMGCYHKHLGAYRRLYAEDRFLVLIFEEDVDVERGSPEIGLAKSCEFLKIDSGFTFPKKQEKIGEYSSRSALVVALAHRLPVLRRSLRWFENRAPVILGSMGEQVLGSRLPKLRPSADTLARLYALYADENEKLAGYIGRIPEAWHP